MVEPLVPTNSAAPTRVLFVGESWQGSNARSLREALARQSNVTVAEVCLDHFRPTARGLPMRLANRLLSPLQHAELERAVFRACNDNDPDCVVFYKGSHFSSKFLKRLKASHVPIVNCFPDYSPHAYGRQLMQAMACYDLVISTKPFHPSNWEAIYSYTNQCVFVPHGYDSGLHLRDELPSNFEFDVVLIATGRPEYFQLISSLAELLRNDHLRVAIGGHGWARFASMLPAGWQIVGARTGSSYIDWLRKGKIVIAPVQRHVVIDGENQPGDEDTARTYELAAANCFFIHQRTELVGTIYDELTEAPMFDTAVDLAEKIRFFLKANESRRTMAMAAHLRAVPAYSVDARAAAIMSHIETLVAARPPPRQC